MSWFKKRKVKNNPETKILQDRSVLKGYIYDIEVDGETKYYHSFLGNDLIFKHGLKSSIISGEVKKSEDGSLEEQFFANSGFKETVFKFVDTLIRQDPSLAKAAKNQVDGYLYIIDKRTPDPGGRVPPFDILGGFKVDNKILGEFQRNDEYHIKSENGFIDFGPANNAKFNAYLETVLISETPN